ncbi:MAG: TonB-dependent receptor plug domain-containing protein, partial [Pseudomonadota bacterium]|nr:TonB-dependent receptor plug domain-containing protein [Pseudomonadota bacterium]
MSFTKTVIATSLGLFSLQPALADTATPQDTKAAVSLPKIGVSGEWYGASEHTGEYRVNQMNTATRLGLSVKETPQSVSVITRQIIDDFELETITDVVKLAPGITAKENDSSRFNYSARGVERNKVQMAGGPTTWASGYSAGETMT